MLCISGATWGCGSARGDPDVWIGLDHLCLVWIGGMDRPVGSGYGSGLLHFDSQPHVPTNSSDVKWVWICLVIARCTSAHLHGFQSSNQALIVDTCGYWYAEYWIHLNTVEIPVQIGPEGLGAPFCSYRTASPRCPSYKLAEPNVHRGRFLLQNGSPSWPLVTKWVTDFCSTRIRSHPLARFALYRMVGTGGGYTRTILGSLGSNLQQPGQPESRFIFSVLLRSSVCFWRDAVWVAKLNIKYNVGCHNQKI